MNLTKGWMWLGLTSALMLSACGGGGDDATPPLSVQEVNALLAGSNSPAPGLQLRCTGSQIAGCFVIPGCSPSSDYYSTRMVYGIDADTMTALLVTYQTSDCSGAAALHPTVRGQWRYALRGFDPATQRGEVSATLVYYADGFVFDTNLPQTGVTYASSIDVSQVSGQARLCLSTPLIDQRRPLKLMSSTAQALDTANCAVRLP